MTLSPRNRSAVLLLLLLLAGCVSSPSYVTASFSSPDCRPLLAEETPGPGPDEFGRGLLWKVSKKGVAPSYVFGTIHVSDRRILVQFDKVRRALADSDVFVMEALPEPNQAALLRQMMFFQDGTRLAELVAPDIYAETVDILGAYHLTEQNVSAMKPWAAYLTMSYPAERGAILDVRLLHLARKAGARVSGLESLPEQGYLFDSLPRDDQVRLLTDGVCYRETWVRDFARLISLYRDENLAGLAAYARRYSFADNTLYENLTEKILTRRNYRMVERMRLILETGSAFIAVGALHLPGEEGVLALLAKEDFEITRVF